MSRPRDPQPPCGTEKAYQWHRQQTRKHGVPKHDCDPCRSAHAAYERERKDLRESLAFRRVSSAAWSNSAAAGRVLR